MTDFKKDEIVYFVWRDGNDLTVRYGIVDEVYSDAIRVDFLGVRENRLVNGVPIMEFESDKKFKKLPKGWSYDTQLHEITFEEYEHPEVKIDLHDVSIKDHAAIKRAYDYGYIVKEEDKFWGVIEEEITKEGYKTVKRYPADRYHICSSTLFRGRLYYTYDEAKKIVDDYYTELERQANLSDEEWSIEQIDKTLDHWKAVYDVPEDKVKAYQDALMKLDRIDEVEVRIYGNAIQWKREKNKRWNNITPELF